MEGSACYDIEGCNTAVQNETYKTSSNDPLWTQTISSHSILSSSEEENPLFHCCNHVYAMYLIFFFYIYFFFILFIIFIIFFYISIYCI